jgi:hypothetical protein
LPTLFLDTLTCGLRSDLAFTITHLDLLDVQTVTILHASLTLPMRERPSRTIARQRLLERGPRTGIGGGFCL